MPLGNTRGHVQAGTAAPTTLRTIAAATTPDAESNLDTVDSSNPQRPAAVESTAGTTGSGLSDPDAVTLARAQLKARGGSKRKGPKGGRAVSGAIGGGRKVMATSCDFGAVRSAMIAAVCT